MRGAGLKCVGGGEMATFRFQVGTCLNISTQLVSEVCKLTWPLSHRLTDSLRMLWDRCHRVVADCPVWASGASPCPHDHFHSSNLSRTNRLCYIFLISVSQKQTLESKEQITTKSKIIFFLKLVTNFFLPSYTASLHRRQLIWWSRSWGWDVNNLVSSGSKACVHCSDVFLHETTRSVYQLSPRHDFWKYSNLFICITRQV